MSAGKDRRRAGVTPTRGRQARSLTGRATSPARHHSWRPACASYIAFLPLALELLFALASVVCGKLILKTRRKEMDGALPPPASLEDSAVFITGVRHPVRSMPCIHAAPLVHVFFMGLEPPPCSMQGTSELPLEEIYFCLVCLGRSCMFVTQCRI